MVLRKQHVFSSQLDDLFNLYVKDPEFIVNDDPIDVLVSNGSYTEVRYMVPFSDFMFIQTGGKTQYELQGSNNFISPSTAVVEPTSFYGSYPSTEPFTMGSQLYWVDSERLYLYVPTNGLYVSQAIEMSKHCRGYLPQNFGSTCVASEADTVFFVDADVPNHIYYYRGQWQADKQIQSSFGRWVLPDFYDVQKIYSLDNKLFVISKVDSAYRLDTISLQRPSEVDLSVNQLPLLDGQIVFSANQGLYDSTSNTTTVQLNGYHPQLDTIVFLDSNSEDYGTVRDVTVDLTAFDPTFGIWTTTIIVPGEIGATCPSVPSYHDLSAVACDYQG